MVDFGGIGDYNRGRNMGLQGAIGVAEQNRLQEERYNKEQADKVGGFRIDHAEWLEKRLGKNHPLLDEIIKNSGMPTFNSLSAQYNTPEAMAAQLNYLGASLALTPPGEATRRITKVTKGEDGNIRLSISVEGEEGEYPFTAGGVRVQEGGEEQVFTEAEFNNMVRSNMSRQSTLGGQAGAGSIGTLIGSMQDTYTDDYSTIRNIGAGDLGGGALGLGNMSRQELESNVRQDLEGMTTDQAAVDQMDEADQKRAAELEFAPTTTTADTSKTGDALFNSVAGQDWRNRDKNQLGLNMNFIGDHFVAHKVLSQTAGGDLDFDENNWTFQMKTIGNNWIKNNPEARDAIFDVRVGPYGIPLDKMKTMQDRQRNKFKNNARLEAEAAAMYRLNFGSTDFASLEELDIIEETMKAQGTSKSAGSYVEADPAYGNTHSRAEVEDAVAFWKNREDIAIKVLSKHPFYNEEYKTLGPIMFAEKYKDDVNFNKHFMTEKENAAARLSMTKALRDSNIDMNSALTNPNVPLTEADFATWAANNSLDDKTDALIAAEIKKLYDPNTQTFDTTHLTTKNKKALAILAYQGLPAELRAGAQGTWWQSNLMAGTLYGTTSTDITNTMALNAQQLQERQLNLQAEKQRMEKVPKMAETGVSRIGEWAATIANYKNSNRAPALRQEFENALSELSVFTDYYLTNPNISAPGRRLFMNTMKMAVSIKVENLANQNKPFWRFFRDRADSGTTELGSDVVIYKHGESTPITDLSQLMEGNEINLGLVAKLRIEAPGQGIQGGEITIGQAIGDIGAPGVKFLIAEAIENARKR